MSKEPSNPSAPPSGAQPPIESEPATLGAASKKAAGIKGVVTSMRIAFREMGPIGATRALLKVNQKDGFDCQSCAWPTPDGHRSFAEFCENGAKAVADEGMTKRITPEFFARHSVAELREQSDYWLGHQGRLTSPMILREGASHYEPIGWDAAFNLVGTALNDLASPNEAAFYTSGRTSNEAAFLYQLFVRQFGTNNLPDCSNMCHEASGYALRNAIGVGKGTVTLEDFEKAEAIFVIGQNPGTNHPRMLSSLQKAKERGCKIVSINVLPEVGVMRFTNPQDFAKPLRALPALLGKATRMSDLWLPVRVNGDMATLKGIMLEMLAAEERAPGRVFDREFIEHYCAGFDAFVEELRRTDWRQIEESSGLTRGQIREAADIAVHCDRIICCWAMGLTQHRNSVATIEEVMNFLFLKGNIGRPGAGACPVRGHSNVQGDRTMGIWERMGRPFLDRLGSEFGFDPPREDGLDTVETIHAMHAGRVRAFLAMGGNFLSATPDTEFTAAALRKCNLTVQVSTKLNRSHLITGRDALILPCLGRSEIDLQAGGPQFVTVEDSMSIVNRSEGHAKPASEHLRSEPAIIAGIARAALGGRSAVDWERLAGDYNQIRDTIARVIPDFANFNERIRAGFFHLPNGPRDRREFSNAERKAKFTVHQIVTQPLEPGQYWMMTIRSHDQFNTTIYGLDDRYRGIYNGRRVIFMNADDLREAGLHQGQFVDLTSHFEGETRTAIHFQAVPYEIPRRCTATYYPETNALVHVGSVGEISNTPASKSVIITVEPSPNAAEALQRWREEGCRDQAAG
ncbi:MAG: FdhF/YdeP family oxidoreductase [Terrimicrobiaceae bacterium]|nr:FdhF/YdeP family oxidoreductase [Terrimicrobiaceae bacterium]